MIVVVATVGGRLRRRYRRPRSPRVGRAGLRPAAPRRRPYMPLGNHSQYVLLPGSAAADGDGVEATVSSPTRRVGQAGSAHGVQRHGGAGQDAGHARRPAPWSDLRHCDAWSTRTFAGALVELAGRGAIVEQRAPTPAGTSLSPHAATTPRPPGSLPTASRSTALTTTCCSPIRSGHRRRRLCASSPRGARGQPSELQGVGHSCRIDQHDRHLGSLPATRSFCRSRPPRGAAGSLRPRRSRSPARRRTGYNVCSVRPIRRRSVVLRRR